MIYCLSCLPHESEFAAQHARRAGCQSIFKSQIVIYAESRRNLQRICFVANFHAENFAYAYKLIAISMNLGRRRMIVVMRLWQVLGHRERFDKIAEQLARGENVVLLANHQTEADPAVSRPLPKASISSQ